MEKKVWLVEYPIPWEQGYFIGIYSTEKLANVAADKHSQIHAGFYRGGYDIDEIKLDVMPGEETDNE